MDTETAREINEVRAAVERERADRVRGEDDIRRAVGMDLGELRREIGELRARVTPAAEVAPGMV